MADLPIETNALTRDQFVRRFSELAEIVRQATRREINAGAALAQAGEERRSAELAAAEARDKFFAHVSAAAGFLDSRLKDGASA